MRVLVSLPGLHRVPRGAEVALEAIADGLGGLGDDVTVFGSGDAIDGRRYRYQRVPAVARERFARFPSVPLFREPSSYESLTFNLAALRRYRPGDFDVTVTCGFPWDNLLLRRPALRGRRPRHVFVTENGDWPAVLSRGEARVFGCDGLVCTNPVYLERSSARWNATLIPNGVDEQRFAPGPPRREQLGLWPDRPVVLMVSALIPSKRVELGIELVAELDGAALVVAGVGPRADEIDRLGEARLGDRYLRRSFRHDEMPDLYRSVDALLHLSHLESFGNVYVEALATGLPVVAHRSPVTTWILGDHAEGLVDTDSATLGVEALRRCLELGREHGAAERRQRAVDHFTWPVIATRYHDFLGSLLSMS